MEPSEQQTGKEQTAVQLAVVARAAKPKAAKRQSRLDKKIELVYQLSNIPRINFDDLIGMARGVNCILWAANEKEQLDADDWRQLTASLHTFLDAAIQDAEKDVEEVEKARSALRELMK